MRNIVEKVRRRDYDQVKADAQAIYRAEDRKQAQAAFRRFRIRWEQPYYPKPTLDDPCAIPVSRSALS